MLRKADGLIKNANSFSASRRRFKVGELEVSPVMAVNKAALSLQTLLYQALHARLIENEIEHFLKTVFLQKYSDIKTPVPRFDF